MAVAGTRLATNANSLRTDSYRFSAVTAVPDSAKGEKIVLLVKGNVNAEDVSRNLRKAGIPPLMQPGAVFVVDNIPKLGSGKWDFNGMKKMAQELVEKKA